MHPEKSTPFRDLQSAPAGLNLDPKRLGSSLSREHSTRGNLAARYEDALARRLCSGVLRSSERRSASATTSIDMRKTM